jgi:hypothetical protein
VCVSCVSSCEKMFEIGAARQDEEAMVRMKVANELHIITTNIRLEHYHLFLMALFLSEKERWLTIHCYAATVFRYG